MLGKYLAMTIAIAFSGNSAFAGSASISNDPGKASFEQTGCGPLSNFTQNLPPEYKVKGPLADMSDIDVCGDIKLTGVDFVAILESAQTQFKKCLTIKIDKVAKSVEITDGPEIKTVEVDEQTVTTYTMNGNLAYVNPESRKMTKKICVLDPAALADKPPYDKFIK